MPAVGVPTRSFSDAKTHLSDVMSGVVREHLPTLIERHGGKERMLLLDEELLRPLLARFEFSTRASISEGEFVLRVPELGLVAGGDTFDTAVDELDRLAGDYAQDLIARYDFFRQTDRADHLPYALRLLLAEPADRRAMLVPRAGSPG